MKQLLSLLLFLGSVWQCHAQDWSPMRQNEMYNYEVPLPATIRFIDGPYCSYPDNNDSLLSQIYTIKIDTAFAQNADSFYVFNRRYLNITNNSTDLGIEEFDTLVLSPHIIGDSMIRRSNGNYELKYNNHRYYLQPQAQLNDTWAWNPSQGIDATIIFAGDTTIFGVSDSIKIIALSNNDTLILSKTMGFWQFPPYRLIGLENQRLGDTIPMFMDIYDYPIGFTVRTIQTSASPEEFNVRQTQITFLSQQITTDTIKYTVEKTYHFSHTVYPSWNCCNYQQYYHDTIDIAFARVEHPSTWNPSEIYGEDFHYNTNAGYWRTFRNKRSDIIKHARSVYSLYPNQKDTLRSFLYEDADAYYDTFFGYAMSRGSSTDASANFYPIGYALNGDTIGDVWSAEEIIFLGSQSPPVVAASLAPRIYPNPAAQYFTLQWSENPIESSFLSIYNLQGQCLYTESLQPISTQEINIADLPAGIYFVHLQNSHSHWVEKLVKQ